MKDINEDLLAIALDKLTVIDLKDIESIEVHNRRYSDTTTLTIEIDYIQGKDIGQVMILTIALLCSIIGGVVGYVIARYVVGKWISNLVLEKLQDVIDDFEYTDRKDQS